ncbi:cytochrome P450 [Aspergillus crustosus]
MLSLILLAAAFLVSVYTYRRIRLKRFIQHAHIAQLPSSLVVGHLKVYHDITQRGAPDRDNDHIFAEIHETLGRPPLFLLDFRPIGHVVVVIANHEIAEQISRPSKQFRNSVPKFNLGYLEPIIGKTSILSAEGGEWRALQKMFLPWFGHQHLLALLPVIMDKVAIFVKQLDELATSGKEVPLVSLMMNLMYDILGAVLLDEDLDAQQLDPGRRGDFVRAYTDLLDAYWDDKLHLPWWCKIASDRRRRRLGERVDRILKSMILRKHHEQHQHQQQQNASGGMQEQKPNTDTTTKFPRHTPLLSLAPQNTNPDTISDPQPQTQTLTPDLLQKASDQLRTFLLGGSESPSATLAWTFYELSRTPHAQSAVQAELNTLFGPNTNADTVHAKLISPAGPGVLGRMTYISAVIKETLRLHTPAATARYAGAGAGSGVNICTPSGENVSLDGVVIYNCNPIIHRDRAVFGESAEQFRPERWLEGDADTDADADDDRDTIGTTSGLWMKIPPSAWRGFERGPRACIGQEFASMTMRAVVAVVARGYEFTKVGRGALALDAATGRPVLMADGQYEVESELYNIRQITARPVDGIMVKVSRVE